MTKEELFSEIKSKRSFLSIGLDPDLRKLPSSLLEHSEHPLFDFNKAIIDATYHLCVAYKLNLAFYECMGSFGLKSFEMTIQYLQQEYPNIFIIADGKRADVNAVNELYARCYFENFKVDALTVSPYMGGESVKPFLKYKDKWTVLISLTANEGREDFQEVEDEHSEKIYERVLRLSKSWDSEAQIMYAIGSADPQILSRFRLSLPKQFLMISGFSVEEEMIESIGAILDEEFGGVLVNTSRNIIYADNTEAFALRAAEEAEKIRRRMSEVLFQKAIVDSL